MFTYITQPRLAHYIRKLMQNGLKNSDYG